MEPSERLERLERTKDIAEIAEHMAWLKGEEVEEGKKAVFDRVIADRVWAALQDDVNSFMTFAALNMPTAINQHAKRLRYYEKVEKLAEELFGKNSPTLGAARAARSVYAGKILGVGLLGAANLSAADIARIVRITRGLHTHQPNITSSHSVIKSSYVYAGLQGMEEAATMALQAAGLEAKMLGVPQTILLDVDRKVEPRGFRMEEVANSAVPRYYKEKVRTVKKHSTKETAFAALKTAGDIRRSEAVLEHVLGERPKSWAQEALGLLYKKLVAMAKEAVEGGDEGGAKMLLHAAVKVRGFHARERKS